jgi:hypothetical protein
MGNKHSTRNHTENKEGFMNENQMEDYFTKRTNAFEGKFTQPYKIQEWFKANNDHPRAVPHHELIGGKFDCDLLTDEWLKFFLTLPAKANPIGMSAAGYINSTQAENVHLFKSGGAAVYLVAVSPAKPDKVRIVITERHPVLISIYYAETSKLETPSLDTEKKLTDLIKDDLAGIREVTATFDEEPVYGCCVIRNKTLRIPNMPKDNILAIPSERLEKNDYTVDLYHGGLWLLLNASNFTPGDHMVDFKAKSINYEIEGKIEISALL